MIDELEIHCPHCWEQLSLPNEIEAGNHTYIEECEFCNHEVEFNFTSTGEEIINLHLHEVSS